jgi:hypothetical protein
MTKHCCQVSQGIQRQARCGDGAGGLELASIVPYVRGQPVATAQAAAIALDSVRRRGGQHSKTLIPREDTFHERASRGPPPPTAYAHQWHLHQKRHTIKTGPQLYFVLHM